MFEREVLEQEILDQRTLTTQWELSSQQPQSIHSATQPTSALSVLKYFEGQVTRSPDAIAVRWDDQSLTYEALNAQANQLARFLRQSGVKSEVRVGLCVHPRLELMMGLLAILKSGGTYVPIDPSYPPHRINDLLSQSQLSVLLTQETVLQTLPIYQGLTLCLDRDDPLWAHFDIHNLNISIEPKQAAYLIYTSGTTGRPKGVIVEHQNLLNYLLTTQAKFQFNAQDVFPCLARFSFSISFFELLSPLLSGGTAVLFSREQVLDIPNLVERLKMVTLLHTVPSLMRQILNWIQANSIDPNLFLGIRQVFLGGDLIPADLVEEMKLVFRGAQIRVLYGCSEVSALALTYAVPRDRPFEKRWVGQPFDRVTLGLYDEAQQPAEVGEIGEIYIGGAGVARGYDQNPELTQEKFITLEGQRFYKTGDRARRWADGNLEFIGRVDYQVKIRGIRIELGEIEAVLNRYPSIRQAVVTASEDRAGDRQLVAYLICRDAINHPISGSKLREFLRQQLPLEMIPAIFVQLDCLPLNPNGKIDRQALPASDVALLLPEDPAIPPRNVVEQRLFEIWQAILHRSDFGVCDRFFDLGGHSLQVAILCDRISREFQKSIPLPSLFDAATIEQIALLICEPTRTSESFVNLNLMQPGDPVRQLPPLFLLSGAHIYRSLTPYLLPEQPIYGGVEQMIGNQRLPNSVEALAHCYVEEILRIYPAGPYYLAGFSFGGMLAYEVAARLRQRGYDVAFLAVMDSLLSRGYRILPTQNRAQSHREKLKQQGLSYIQEKLWDRYIGTREYVRTLSAKLFLKLGLPLSQWQAYHLMASDRWQMQLVYDPQPENLSMVLIKATERIDKHTKAMMPLLGWDDIVQGEIEVLEIAGTHNGILDEPLVQTLGKQLRTRLSARLDQV